MNPYQEAWEKFMEYLRRKQRQNLDKQELLDKMNIILINQFNIYMSMQEEVK